MQHKLINLTPHPITIIVHDDHRITLPPAAEPARVSSDTYSSPPLVVDGEYVPVTAHRNQHVSNVPPAEEGIIYIAPLLVALTAKRSDVLAPDRLIRDANGQPIGCYGLVDHN